MRFLVSLYATPNPAYQDIFYTVPRAGHLIAGDEHRIRRDHFPGHELILCRKGTGFVRVRGVTHTVSQGDFAWVNCHQPHEHGGSHGDPWEVLWVRIEGPRLEKMCTILATATQPVFTAIDTHAASALYQQIFHLMAAKPTEPEPRIHALVGQLIALAFAARRGATAQSEIPAALQKALDRMRLFYFEQHRVDALAEMCGMSTPHFARLFKAAMGTSPIDWLRKERINQAKRRLGDTTESIQRIADQVGYRDRFFFSKDFKKLTGFTPRQFRSREKAS